jgi:7-keto-8-aminopelargonate synthetase-like enzyme
MTISSLIKNPLLLRIERLIKNRYNENKLRSLQKLDDNNNNLIDFSSNDYISYARNRKIAKRVDILYNDYINNNKDNIPILGSTGSRYVFIINYL